MPPENLVPRGAEPTPKLRDLLVSDDPLEPSVEARLRQIVEHDPDPIVRGDALVVLAADLRRQGRVEQPDRLYREGLALLRGSGSEAELRGNLSYAMACFIWRRVFEALLFARRAATLAEALDDPRSLILARGHLVGALFELGDLDGGERVLERMATDLPRVAAAGRPAAERRVASYRLDHAARRDDADGAAAAIAELEQLEPPRDQRSNCWCWALVHVAAGRHAEALSEIAAVRSLSGEEDRFVFEADLLETRCRFALDDPAAIEAARTALARLESPGQGRLSAALRMQLAEQLGKLLQARVGRCPEMARAFDVAGAAALERLGEFQRFLDETPGAGATEELEDLLAPHGERLLARHRALLAAVRAAEDVTTIAAPRPEDGVLRVCSWCRSVHGPDDVWIPMDRFRIPRGRLLVSHGICPECRRGLRR